MPVFSPPPPQKKKEELDIPVSIDDFVLLFQNVDKVYGSGFHAVKGISVGVPKNECFGLLGQNGAGKTSTFKMLTGAEPLTSGNAYLNGYSVKGDIKQVISVFTSFNSLPNKKIFIYL